MKPEEYIRELKQKYPEKAVSSRHLSNALETTLGLGSDQISNITSKFSSEDYAELLYERLKPRLDNNFESVINEGLLAFGEINNPLPNAYTEETSTLSQK